MQFVNRGNCGIFINMRITNEVNVLSIGDKVPVRVYQHVYTAHEQVLNFWCGRLILSVGASGLCYGPYRIVLNTDNVQWIKRVELKADMLVLNGDIILPISGEMRYHAREISGVCDANALRQNVLDSYAAFVKQAVPESIIGLVRGATWQESGVLRALASFYKRGIRHFIRKEYAQGVQCYRHRGLGLTPAGDDFLVGLLLGMAWLMRVQKKELSKIMDLIFHESDVKHALIRTFMVQAVALELDADWADFLGNLAAAEGRYEPGLEAILSHGASSGADQLSGFYLACAVFGTGFGLDITGFIEKEV